MFAMMTCPGSVPNLTSTLRHREIGSDVLRNVIGCPEVIAVYAVMDMA
jgi:hypothetical protein